MAGHFECEVVERPHLREGRRLTARSAASGVRSHRLLLGAYCLVAAGDAILAARGARRARRVTKPLLMPLLASDLTGPGPTKRLLRGGLGLSFAGDVALLGRGERPFAAGLASFLAAHGCYLAACHRHRHCGVRRAPWVAGAYGVAWVGLNATLAPRTGRFRVPVFVYGTALTAMALAALDTGLPAVAVGGALFVVSDSLLALDRFGVAQLPGADGIVMLTYTAAQALIAHGLTAAGPE